jgi:hypothetical protein
MEEQMEAEVESMSLDQAKSAFGFDPVDEAMTDTLIERHIEATGETPTPEQVEVLKGWFRSTFMNYLWALMALDGKVLVRANGTTVEFMAKEEHDKD